MTLQCDFVNSTLHPASQSTRIPVSDVIDNHGTMCPISTIVGPGIFMSHMCVDLTLLPSSKLMVSRVVAGHKFSTGVPSIMKMDVTPVFRNCLCCCNGYCAQILLCLYLEYVLRCCCQTWVI